MPAHPILTSLNQIVGKNTQIQNGNFPQQIKDESMKITNKALDFTVKELSQKKINELVLNEYRSKNKR